MGEKETPEMVPRGENINASWDVVGEAATHEFTFPRDRRPANIKAGWDIAGKGATESFQKDLRPSIEPVDPNKYEIHDSQISPESYNEAIDLARGFGPGVRGIRGRGRIGLAKRFAVATAVVFAIYGGARGVGGKKEMKAEDINSGFKSEQKVVPKREYVGAIQESQKEASATNTLYTAAVGGGIDLDGGSPGGMTEKGVPLEEAAKNVYGDGVYHEAIKSRQAEENKGEIEVGNKDYEEYLHMKNQGEIE